VAGSNPLTGVFSNDDASSFFITATIVFMSVTLDFVQGHRAEEAGTEARIIGRAYDEIILEVPDEMGNYVAPILPATMLEAGKAYLVRVTVEVEVDIGNTWAEK